MELSRSSSIFSINICGLASYSLFYYYLSVSLSLYLSYSGLSGISRNMPDLIGVPSFPFFLFISSALLNYLMALNMDALI